MKRLLLTCLLGFVLSCPAFAAVNINTATKEELQTLDGIGPKKAQAIIDYRKKNGSFKSINDLEGVDGIGPNMVTHIKKDVSLTGTTTIPADKNKKDKTKKNKAKEAKKTDPKKTEAKKTNLKKTKN